MKGKGTVVGAKRLSKEQRRRQLLDTALEIIRSEGTDALTLGYLAERSGVSKPIAYEHFGTRAGVLIALYRACDERQRETMHEALRIKSSNAHEIAAVLSTAYIDCVLSATPEFGAIAAALAATEEMEAFRRSLQSSYMAEIRAAFTPVGINILPEGNGLLIGVLGAAEMLAQAAINGTISRDEAADSLVRIIVASLRLPNHCHPDPNGA